MNLHPIFFALLQKKSLSEKQAMLLFAELFKQKIPTREAKNLLLLLARKGETAAEVSGCVQALEALEPPFRTTHTEALMDTCGTGGDGSHSLNISTLAAFLIAGAGGKIAKHGNRGLSSPCGSSDLLEALGVKLEAGKARMMKALNQVGIAYFHAPYYHPVFSRMQPLRKSLGVRTLFNLLGPLANPCEIRYQLVGVSKKEYLDLFAQVLCRKGVKRALICHSQDGLDEISVQAPTWAIWIDQGKISYEIFQPKKFGMKSNSGGLKGGDPHKNKSLSLKLLQGKLKGIARNTVILNAAAGLLVSGLAKDWGDGLHKAEISLDSKKAYQTLLGLIEISREKS